MEFGEMSLYNNPSSTDEENAEVAENNHLALSGWSLMALERDTPLAENNHLTLSGWSLMALERDTPSNTFRSLYFCMADGDFKSHSFSWYSIKFKMNHISSSSASTCRTTWSRARALIGMPSKVPRRFVAVALGTRIYAIGGCTGHCNTDFIFHSDVFYFDFTNPVQGWKEGPPLMVARYRPSAVVVDNQIYVFGGMKNDEDWYGEVLDPLQNVWKPLPHRMYVPPICVGSSHALLRDNENNRHILFQPLDEDYLLSYNIEFGQWEMFDKCFGCSLGLDDTSVVVDGVLYCYYEPTIHAYDLLKRKWVSKPVRGLPREDMRPPKGNTVFLFRIGGNKLGLFWADVCKLHPPRMIAVSTIFTLEKDQDLLTQEPEVTANIQSVTTCYLKGYSWETCVAL